MKTWNISFSYAMQGETYSSFHSVKAYTAVYAIKKAQAELMDASPMGLIEAVEAYIAKEAEEKEVEQ